MTTRVRRAVVDLENALSDVEGALGELEKLDQDEVAALRTIVRELVMGGPRPPMQLIHEIRQYEAKHGSLQLEAVL